MPNSKPLETEIAPPAFESDVQRTLSALQAALTAAVESLPEYPRKAPDLTRMMGLERNVAWKLFRLIHERDVFVAARFVPGSASIASFVSGAASAGVPVPLLERITEAAGRYGSVVRRHAGDRVSADIMLGVKTGEAVELALRRGAFRSMSYLAGVQAQVQLQTFVLTPGPSDPNVLDGFSLSGFVELTRMRPDAPVVIGRAESTDQEGKVLEPVRDEPIDGPLGPGEYVPLLKDFCSTPLPRFRRGPGERGFVENELAEGPVGKTGAITFMSGNVVRGVGARYKDEQNPTMDVVARLRTPTAVLICDMLVHEEVIGDAMPRAGVYSDLFGYALRRGLSRERYRLASVPKVEALGQGASAVQTPEIPRYSRMIEHVMDRLSWDVGRFRVYRVRIEFPFTPTSVMVSFDLMERPSASV